jgi:hypothetical protein
MGEKRKELQAPVYLFPGKKCPLPNGQEVAYDSEHVSEWAGNIKSLPYAGNRILFIKSVVNDYNALTVPVLNLHVYMKMGNYS